MTRELDAIHIFKFFLTYLELCEKVILCASASRDPRAAKNRGRQGRLRQPEGGGARVDLHPSRRARGRGSGIRPPAARGIDWIHGLDPRAGVGSPARAHAKSRDVDLRPLP